MRTTPVVSAAVCGSCRSQRGAGTSHSATLSSRDQRLAETLQIEKQRVESEVRELKMLKNALESRLEEQRMNLEVRSSRILSIRVPAQCGACPGVLSAPSHMNRKTRKLCWRCARKTERRLHGHASKVRNSDRHSEKYCTGGYLQV
jgi:hypothetical protein